MSSMSIPPDQSGDTRPARAASPAARGRALPRVLLAVWMTGLLALVALAWWTGRPYWLDLASHFLVSAAVGLGAIGLGLAGLRRWPSAGVTLAAALAIPLIARSDATAPVASAVVPAGFVRLKLVQYNAYGEHSRNDKEFMSWLRDQEADLVAIIDPPWGWRRDYPYLTREYPSYVEPQPGLEWPIILLSRLPAEVSPLVEYSDKVTFSFVGRRSLLVRVGDGSLAGAFLFTGMHPPSPRTPKSWGNSLEVVERDGPILRDWMERSGLPVIVSGDFNSTVQGRVHRTLARLSGMSGWSPVWNAGTWPASMPSWLSLPIDRVFTGGGAVVRSMVVGPRFRSDHRPVVMVVDVPIVKPRADDGP